ncbi:uncharacterized protein LOC119272698, partial [Triticum dicoccoides]|uniref:uncharacterized protein LOC119272698 n=1 Tax=Triticum dicoccoides TaxID=85692 RepID=UPI00188FEC6B
MLVDSDTASLDTFPTNMVVSDEPPPCAESGESAVMEVLVIGHIEHSGGGAQDPLNTALQDLTAPIPEDTDTEMLEACRIQLVEGVKKLASMRRLSEAYRCEMDRAVGGTPAPAGPSHLRTVQQRRVAIANLFWANHPVYATPAENIRAAQAAVEELDKFEGEERRQMAERVQRLLDAAAEQHERIGSTRQAIPTGVALQCLLKPSIKPSPESDSIFVSAPPEVVGSDLRAPAAGTGIPAGGPGAAAVALGPGTSKPSPGTEAASPETSKPGPGTDAVGPGTSSTQEAAADSNRPPPGPTALVQVAVLAIEEIAAPSWAQPILNFLVNKELPTNEISAQQVQCWAAAYTIVNRELVRCSVTGVYQRCVKPEQGQAILKDIHQGECGHHAASRALVAKAFCHGFFWPTALEDAKDLVQKCKGCQKFRSKPHQTASALKTIPIAWPFAVWG